MRILKMLQNSPVVQSEMLAPTCDFTAINMKGNMTQRKICHCSDIKITQHGTAVNAGLGAMPGILVACVIAVMSLFSSAHVCLLIAIVLLLVLSALPCVYRHLKGAKQQQRIRVRFVCRLFLFFCVLMVPGTGDSPAEKEQVSLIKPLDHATTVQTPAGDAKQTHSQLGDDLNRIFSPSIESADVKDDNFTTPPIDMTQEHNLQPSTTYQDCLTASNSSSSIGCDRRDSELQASATRNINTEKPEGNTSVTDDMVWLHSQLDAASQYAEELALEESAQAHDHMHQSPQRMVQFKAYLNQHLSMVLVAQKLRADIKECVDKESDRVENAENLLTGPRALNTFLTLVCRGTCDQIGTAGRIDTIAREIMSCFRSPPQEDTTIRTPSVTIQQQDSGICRDMDNEYMQRIQTHMRQQHEIREKNIQSKTTYPATQEQQSIVKETEHSPSTPETNVEMENSHKPEIVAETDNNALLTKAARSGDNDVVESIFKSCESEEERSKCLETVIKESVNNNDTGLIRYITRRYRIALKDTSKLLKLRDPLAILYECVYKNNSVLAKVIADSIAIEHQTKLQNTYEELLMTAIERGCQVSLIRVLDNLWWRSLGCVKRNYCIPQYKNLLVKIRDFSEFNHDEQIYLYSMIQLELVTLDKRIGMDFLKALPHLWLPTLQSKMKKSMNVPLSPKYHLSYVFDQNATFEEYEHWNDNREKFSCRPGYIRQPDVSDYDVVCGVIDAVDKTGCHSAQEETELVRNAIATFMQALCDTISTHNPEMKCRPKLVGSAIEGTRSFLPNEFDFLIIFETIAKRFTIKECFGQFLFELKSSMDSSKLKSLHSLLEEYENAQYLSPHSFKECLNQLVSKCMHENVCSLWGPIRVPLNANETKGKQLCSDSRLTMNPVGFFTKKPTFSTVNLEWRGKYFKDMLINIDLVPAFPYDGPTCLPQHDFLLDNEQLHIIAHGYPIGYQLGFSVVENRLLCNIPSYIRQGYRYAKAMRCAFVLSTVRELELVDNFEDLITSYMLKTSLLFLTQDSIKNNSEHSTDPIHWTIRIYERLHEFLENDCRIPSFFLNNSNVGDGDCLFKIGTSQIHVKLRERRSMFLAIDQILSLLKCKKSSLSAIQSSEFKERKKVDLASWPASLNVIRNELWCCCNGVIDILTPAMKRLRSVSLDEGVISSVVDIGDCVVIATEKRLLTMSYTGKIMATISNGDFTSISLHAGLLYVANCDVSSESSYIHVYHPSTWRCTREIILPCSGAHFHTLCVTSNDIILGCWNEQCIYALDYDGNMKHKYGTSGALRGELHGPFLCKAGREGCMLVADWGNDRLLMYHEGEWRVLALQQHPPKPTYALLSGKVLYVAGSDKKLRMYQIL